MLIKMNKTTKGSENGYVVKEFIKGEIYDVNDSLAKAFVKDLKVAIEVKKAPAVKNKAITSKQVENKELPPIPPIEPTEKKKPGRPKKSE